MKKTDKDILEVLRADSRLTPDKIAAAVGMTIEEVKTRIRALEDSGIIAGYTAILNTDELDENAVEAFIEVKVDLQRGHGYQKLAQEIVAYSEVKNLYLVSGGYDLVVIVRGNSMGAVSRFVSEKICTCNTVISTSTHFILKKYKVEGATIKNGDGDDRLIVQA